MPASIVLPILLLVTAPGPVARTWDVDGVKREALIREPAKRTEGGIPVVFDFHGHGGTARNSDRVHHLHEAWPEALVVSMQGLPSPGHLTDAEGKKAGWQRRPGDQGDRDLKFFDAVLASLKRDYPIDGRRVYATGHSNGGAFVYLLWATRGDALAACAPVATAAGPYLARPSRSRSSMPSARRTRWSDSPCRTARWGWPSGSTGATGRTRRGPKVAESSRRRRGPRSSSTPMTGDTSTPPRPPN